MLAALEQAWLGRGSCAPNPSVGAVAVHQGEIIARAWHQGAGTAHAEQLILHKIPQHLKGVILYVTLEPCNHWGRTPPCVSGIIEHGISQVVYGFNDPNPLVMANNTPALLREKGIEALHYPLPEIEDFYKSYWFWTRYKKPWVTVKLALSLDGKVAKKNNKPQTLSNEDCSKFTHLKRQQSDVILTTEKTVRFDDPLLNVRREGQEEGKVIAIIDSRLSLKKNAKLFKKAKHCHIYHDKNYSVRYPIANCSYHPISATGGRLNLDEIIIHLGELGYHDVWVEAGGLFFSTLHGGNHVQRTYLYLTPLLLGSEAIPAFVGEEIFKKKPEVNWQIKEDNVIACLNWQEE